VSIDPEVLLIYARTVALQVAQRQQMDTRYSTTLTEVAEELERWLVRAPLGRDEPSPVDAGYVARLAGALARLVDEGDKHVRRLPAELRQEIEHARSVLKED
jgi:hypothetical protein